MLHRLSPSPFHFLPALLISEARAFPTSIWHVSIFQGPAPPPEDGPPIAASAVRDRSFLPVQIGSIVGAYCLTVIVVAAALLLVGRRLRRAAQSSPRTLAMQMMKSFRTDTPKAFDPSPITPTANNPFSLSPNSTLDMKSSWPSPEKTKSSNIWPSIGKSHRKQASMQSSVVTFDESVIEEDKTKNQQEMDRLYAAVMEHDDIKSNSRLDLAEKQGPQNPPELQHLRSGSMPQPSSSIVPRTDTKSPARTLTTSPHSQTRPSPITIHSRTASRSSLGSFSKKRSVRDLPISPPIGSPDLGSETAGIYGESEPLSPRFYKPGPPPPTPPMRQHASIPEDGFDASQRSPRRVDLPNFDRAPRTSIPTVQASEVPTHPQVQPSKSDRDIPLRELSKQKRTPAPLALRTDSASSPAPTTHHPLRSAPLPLRNLRPGYSSDRPPSTIKATVLERKIPDQRVPYTPRTGVPSTPYSPYMPFTPLTPMTPSRLVTKQERKRREKEEGRRVATIDDAVEEEADMWGSGYP